MKKFIKKYLPKILIALSLCLTLVLAITFTPKTYAQTEDNNGYEILPNGIQSKNLFNYSNIFQYQAIGNNPNSYYSYSSDNVLVSSHNSWVQNIGFYIYLSANTTYTISAYGYSTSGTAFIRMSSTSADATDLGYMNFSTNNQYTYNSFTFTTNQDSCVISLGSASSSSSTSYFKNIMLNVGNTALNYFPYSSFNGYNQYNWNNDLIEENEILKQQLNSIPKNYFTYIIGNNYFNNSNFIFNQRLSNFNGTLKIASAPLNTPNTYIEGNKLYLSQLFNYSYNNSKALDDNFNYVNVYNAPNYSTSNFTYLSLFPHYNLPSNERSGMAMPLKYVNIIIDGSNYNGSIRLTTQIPNGTTSDTYQYIDISKNSDNNFIINYPDSENYLISIDIQATYSNGAYNVPTEIISNVEQVNAVSDYQIGYDTAKSEYGNIIAQNNNSISNLQEQIEQNDQTIVTLRQRVNDLQEQVNNNFGFQNVFFAMADTPFKTVSNFLGFELFGVNLFQALIGFITVLACIWLIKKLI